jgi:hypothetical protein
VHGDGLAHSPACHRAHRVTAGCPVDYLASLLPSRILGRLARAHGRRGQPVASCGVPTTVGDVARLYREGRLGEIAGLGARSISEIKAGLVLAGLVLDASTPAPQPLHTCRVTEPARATTAGDTRSFGRPGSGNRRRGPGGG